MLRLFIIPSTRELQVKLKPHLIGHGGKIFSLTKVLKLKMMKFVAKFKKTISLRDRAQMFFVFWWVFILYNEPLGFISRKDQSDFYGLIPARI